MESMCNWSPRVVAAPATKAAPLTQASAPSTPGALQAGKHGMNGAGREAADSGSADDGECSGVEEGMAGETAGGAGLAFGVSASST